MNLATSLLLVGLGTAYLGKLGFVQATNTAPQELSALTVQYYSANSALPFKTRAYPKGVVILKDGKFVPAARALKPPSTNPPALSSVISNATVVPKPGVYKTDPYKGMVIVPDKHPDDRAIVNLERGDFKMPVFQPDLRFLPLNPASK